MHMCTLSTYLVFSNDIEIIFLTFNIRNMWKKDTIVIKKNLSNKKPNFYYCIYAFTYLRLLLTFSKY